MFTTEFRSQVRPFVFAFALFTLVGIAAPVLAQSGCVAYEGLRHCPIGTASLSLEEDDTQLLVRLASSAGQDGVAVSTPDATFWTSQAEVSPKPGFFFATARAEGSVVSTTTLSRDADVAFAATFTGGSTSGKVSYSALVYNGGRFVGGLGGVPSGSTAARVLDFCDTESPHFVPEFCEVITSSFGQPPTGECIWGYVFPLAVPLTLADGRVLKGDEVRLVEEIDAGGSYPYLSFDGVTLQATGDSLRLLSESTSR